MCIFEEGEGGSESRGRKRSLLPLPLFLPPKSRFGEEEEEEEKPTKQFSSFIEQEEKEEEEEEEDY